MIRIKQSAAARLPIRLRSAATGAPLSGVLYSAITAAAEKADGTQVVLTVTAPDWVQLTTGAFAGSGNYTLLVSGSVTDVVGHLRVVVVASGALEPETLVLDVAAYLDGELMEGIDAASNSAVDAQASSALVLSTALNSRQIFATGDDANREVLYGDDGETVLAKWALKDENGEPTVGPTILQRIRVNIGEDE